MSIMRRNDFLDFYEKNAAGCGDSFTFKSEWLNIIKGKNAEYRAWFYDVIVAYGIHGQILADMPDSMKVDMKPIIDEMYESIVLYESSFVSKLNEFEMMGIIDEYEAFCREVEELKETGAKEV